MSEEKRLELFKEIKRLKAVSRTTLDPEKISRINKKIEELEKVYISAMMEKKQPEQ